MRKPALAAVFSVGLLSAGAAPPASTIVPMQPYGTQPAVRATVNGRASHLFLIDTGASGQARIDRDVVDKLDIPIVGKTKASGIVATQAPVQINEVRVDSLAVGSRTYRNVAALSRGYNDPDGYQPTIGGILAFSLFADQLLTLDFCHRQVRISSGSLPPPNGETIIRYEEREGVPYVPITIGGVTEMALLDTGTDRALDLPVTMVRRLFLANAPHPMGRVEGVGGTVSGIGATHLRDDLMIAGQRFQNVEATFSNAWSTVVLGSAAFHRYALTFDQRNKRLRLVRPKGC